MSYSLTGQEDFVQEFMRLLYFKGVEPCPHGGLHANEAPAVSFFEARFCEGTCPCGLIRIFNPFEGAESIVARGADYQAHFDRVGAFIYDAIGTWGLSVNWDAGTVTCDFRGVSGRGSGGPWPLAEPVMRCLNDYIPKARARDEADLGWRER